MKRFWKKLHSILGMTAGIVLGVVGITGALQSFEEDLLHALNRKIFALHPDATPDLRTLFAQVQSSLPGKRIVNLQLHSIPGYPIRVGYVEREQAMPEQGGKQSAPRPLTEYRYLNRNTGELYPPLRGEGFFRIVNDIHRRLAAGDIGKQIVGASVLGLVMLCLSGLYLRWPHNPLNWRAWFKLDFTFKGRRFLRDLHMITGTWLLLLLLLSALTGLYWSYDWYKDGLHTLTGTTRPAREVKLEQPAQGIADIENLWQIFLRQSNGLFHDATVRFPEKPGHALEIRYLDLDPPHNRAFSRLFLHPVSGAIVAHDRYNEKSAGGKLMAGIYPLHTGSFFGLPGTLLMMISALILPLFVVTGWWMFLDRHRREERAAMAVTRLRAGKSKGMKSELEIRSSHE